MTVFHEVHNPGINTSVGFVKVKVNEQLTTAYGKKSIADYFLWKNKMNS